MNHTTHAFGKLRSTAQALIVALLATLLVASIPMASSASINHGAIAYNSGTCELTAAGFLGDGSAGNPYQISDSESLWEVADCSMTGSPAVASHFTLISHVNVSGSTAPTTSPIGFSTSGDIAFKGVLSGSVNIDGIRMISSTTDVALFSVLKDATISGLVIAGEFVTTGVGKSAAVLAVKTEGLTHINGVSVPDYLGPVSVSGQAVSGGLVAVAERIVLDDVHVRAEVTTQAGGGGLVGKGLQVTIRDSTYNSTVWGQNHNVSAMLGGLVGEIVTQSGPNPPRLLIENSSNLGHVLGHDDVGGLVGRTRGVSTISTSVNEGRVEGNGTTFGGLVGDALDSIQLSIDASQNLGNVSAGESQAGGFIGAAQGNVQVTNSLNFGEVMIGVTGDYSAGGLLGLSSPTGPAGSTLRVSGFINYATVSATVARAGGLVGHNQIPAEITNSSNHGLVHSKDYVGGLVGLSTQPITLSNVVNSGRISGSSAVRSFGFGGIIGSASSVVGAAVSNTGIVAGGSLSESLGGLFGRAEFVDLANSSNSGTISGNATVGGFIGLASSLSLSNLVNQGTVTAFTANFSKIGGLVGTFNSQATVSASINRGNILAGQDYVGGLIGEGRGPLTLLESRNYGNLSVSGSGADFLGGLAGYLSGIALIQRSANFGNLETMGRQGGGILGHGGSNARITMSEVANHGSIISNRTDNSEIGGLVGTIGSSAWAQIIDSYNLGTVSGHVEVAGLVGLQEGLLTISRSFNAGTVGAVSSEDPIAFSPISATTSLTSVYALGYASVPGDPLATISTLQSRSTYTGWDFNTIWGFGTCSENNGLPSLRVLGLFATYYSDGCYTAPQTNNGGTSGGSGAIYLGPIITSMSSKVVVGEPLEVEGRRLDSVLTVSIAGILQEIVSTSPTTLVVLISSSTAVGVADLVLESGFGKLTVQQALNVLEAKAVHPLIGKTKVLALSKAKASAWLATNLSESGLQRVVCTVTVADGASMADRVLARKSAKQTCSEVGLLLDAQSLWFQTKVTKHSSFVGRTMLTFKG